MIKIFLSLILILLSINAYGFGMMQMMQGSSGTGSMPACNAASDDVGDRTEYAGSLGMGTNYVSCVPYTASCTGTLGYGYAFHQGTPDPAENLKIFVASRTGVNPEDETIIGNAGVISSSTDAEWAKSADKLTGSVTKDAAYWLCWVSDTNFSMYLQTTGTVSRWYNPITGSYATPTLNAGDAWTESTTNEFSAYVEIE